MVRIAFTVRRSFTSWPSASDRRDVTCRFGMKRRLVLLLAWLTWLPTRTPLPVISQRRAIAKILFLQRLRSKQRGRTSVTCRPGRRGFREGGRHSQGDSATADRPLVTQALEKAGKQRPGGRRGRSLALGDLGLQLGQPVGEVRVGLEALEQPVRHLLPQPVLGLVAAAAFELSGRVGRLAEGLDLVPHRRHALALQGRAFDDARLPVL